MLDRIDKRYQVFVSSTYQDLQDERQEVMQALLELDCIPAGMELFPAANQDQWTLIKKVIDDCDYYIVISAGRYGSLGPDGVGFTELEYRYAVEQGKPVIGFLHRDLASIAAGRCESSSDGKAKLEAFRQLIQQKVVRFWESPTDLGSQVSRSLVKLIRNEPAIGWVRADLLPSEDATRELLTLRKKVEQLEGELQRARFSAPAGAEGLAQGDEAVVLDARFEGVSADGDSDYDDKITYGFETTWDALFAAIAPTMIDEASEARLRSAMLSFVHSIGLKALDEDDTIHQYEPDIDTWELTDQSYQSVKVQLRALGLIAKSSKPRSLKDSGTYWTLTPLGDELMTRLRAIKRGESQTNTAPRRPTPEST